MPPTWGDTVRVKPEAPPYARPGDLGEVVGIREVENEQQSGQFGAPIGARIYLIEFGDGCAVEIPEHLVGPST